MKILKRGTLPEERILNATCRKCQTEFEFAQSETTTVHDQREGDYLSIRCPLCSAPVFLSSKSNPPPRFPVPPLRFPYLTL